MAKILVVDDDPAMQRATSRALEAAGHAVAVHANGRGAVRDIENCPPDLLITDIFMPEMEGLETIREARAPAEAADHRDIGRVTGLPRHRRKVRRHRQPQKAVPAGRADRSGQPAAGGARRLSPAPSGNANF
jgi:CheY-like chemotaxis protein